MKILPKARTSDILEMEADQDLVIYDLRINKAFNLNETSKAVYRACGSNVSFEELKRTFKFTDDLIHFALDELAANNLLEDKVGNYFAGLSRREVIRRVGLASIIALPVITGIVTPTAANAASVCPAPSGFNVPSGCPVGTPLTGGNRTCAGVSDADKDDTCNFFYNGRCQSGSARYATGTCVESGNSFTISCTCN